MSSMLRMCLNWKVLAGLALVAVGVGIYSPDLLGKALPILILAICPLSMMWMMREMDQGEDTGSPPPTPNPSDDPAALRAQMTALAAEQEQISEKLARVTLGASQPSSDNGPRADSTPDNPS